jgi:hypothetical protein
MGPWNGMSISDGNTPPRAGDCFASGTWFFKASNAMLYRSPHRGHTLQAMIQLELRVPPNPALVHASEKKEGDRLGIYGQQVT